MDANETRARLLFLAMLERSPDEWSEFLEVASAGDEAARDRAEVLLRAHQAQGTIEQATPFEEASTADPPFLDRPGTVIGPYKLLERIGEGGFGTVFLAEQSAPIRRKVALKVLKPGMDSRQVVARFEAERQALAIMDHPHIARVFDGGATSSGRPYFVMELVKGMPITEFCDRHCLNPHQRLELFVQVCQAVQHAHQKGVIHRDLKPSNVLVSRHDATPMVKVIDFGVAKALGQELTDKTLFTGIAQMIGTPQYMSPEQAGRSDLDVDTRSDIYSLGVLIYELLTGSTPFEKERLRGIGYDEIRRIICEEEPPRPSTRLSTIANLPTIAANRSVDPRNLSGLVRGELDWVVMKAMEKDRNRRYESASGLAADIQRYLAGEAVLAVPPSTGYRLRKFARRNRGALVVGGLLGLLLLLLVVGLPATAFLRYERDSALENQVRAERAELKAREAENENRIRAHLARAIALSRSRQEGQRFGSLEEIQYAMRLNPSAELRNELRDAAIAALALPDLYDVGPWHPWPADSDAVDFNEALTLYARTDHAGNCSVRRVADDSELCRIPGRAARAEGEQVHPRFGGDGRFLALNRYLGGPAVRNVAVEIFELGSSSARPLLSLEGAGRPAFHPRLPQVAVTYDDGTIELFELPGGGLVTRLPPDTHTQVGVALHPTAPVVAVGCYSRRDVQFRDLGNKKVLGVLPIAGWVTTLAWSPDGRTLAVGYDSTTRGGHIQLFDYVSRKLIRTIEGGSVPTQIVFNPQGDVLVTSGWGGVTELFDVGTGRKLFTATSSAGLRLSRDGRRLGGILRDGKLGFKQVGDGRECRTLTRYRMPEEAWFIEHATISPDGRLLAAAMSDRIGLWDLSGGDELAFIPLPPGTHHRVLFETSGSLLVLGATGLYRWPVRGAATAEVVVGPPERLAIPCGHILGQSRDSQVVVAACSRRNHERPHAGGWVLRADQPDRPIRVAKGEDIEWIAVSPDGKWVVTVAFTSRKAEIWDARSGTLVKTLADFGAGFPHFSPDRRWLATGLDDGRLFEVETWKPGHQVGGSGFFSHDGKHLALQAGAETHLVKTETGHRLAKLEDPYLESCCWPVCSPDGTRLVSLRNGKNKIIQVWDLRLVRQQLAELGLDWDAPPYLPSSADLLPPPKVQIVPAAVLSREDRARRDIQYRRQQWEEKPHDATMNNNLAWIYLVAPEPLRDAKAALPLAEKAFQLNPRSPVIANTLGVARYRAGQYREAVQVLRANNTRQMDQYLAFDLYILAMCYQRLGEAERAREYYDWAARWSATQRNLRPEHIEELNLFRAEASALLGLGENGGPKAKP